MERPRPHSCRETVFHIVEFWSTKLTTCRVSAACRLAAQFHTDNARELRDHSGRIEAINQLLQNC
jgi:hypothetical protein